MKVVQALAAKVSCCIVGVREFEGTATLTKSFTPWCCGTLHVRCEPITRVAYIDAITGKQIKQPNCYSLIGGLSRPILFL